MPVYTVADACYTPITGIPYCRGRHLQHVVTAAMQDGVDGITTGDVLDLAISS